MTTSPQKIVHITETMASGVLKYLQEVTTACENRDVQQIILYSQDRLFTPKKLDDIFPKDVELQAVHISLGNFGRSLKELYRHIREIKPDIVHMHSSIAGLYGRLLAIAFPKTSFYYTPHGYSFLMTNKSLAARSIYWICELVLSLSKASVIACSKSEFRHAKRLSLLSSVFLLENAIIPNNEIANIRALPYQVVGVGRMEEQKDPKAFIRIVAKLRHKHSDLVAVWIGDGSLMEVCVSLDHELGTGVTFTGWISNEETLNYLKNSNCFLQTSKWEGLPYSVLEAMAVGLPVVANNLEFHKDLFEQNYKGFLAEDEEGFVRFVSRLKNDDKLADNISEWNKTKLLQNHQEFIHKLFSIYYKR